MISAVNGRHHRIALGIFMVIVVAHWAEHIAQAIQLWLLHWPLREARGVLGLPFPWLIRSEWLHYGYAILMLAGLIMLRPGFAGRSRRWWNLGLGIQVWHHFEHLLLLVQALTGSYLLGHAVPTSIIQLVVPRVQLHLFYNAAVFLPMMVAVFLHKWPSNLDRVATRCTCAYSPGVTVA
jgi:hypothetical protein